MRWLLLGAGIGLTWLTAGLGLTTWFHLTHKRPAGGEPPAIPRAGASHLLPGHHHGGIDTIAKGYHCGCIHLFDGTGRLLFAYPCADGDEIDQLIKDLLS